MVACVRSAAAFGFRHLGSSRSLLHSHGSDYVSFFALSPILSCWLRYHITRLLLRVVICSFTLFHHLLAFYTTAPLWFCLTVRSLLNIIDFIFTVRRWRDPYHWATAIIDRYTLLGEQNPTLDFQRSGSTLSVIRSMVNVAVPARDLGMRHPISHSVAIESAPHVISSVLILTLARILNREGGCNSRRDAWILVVVLIVSFVFANAWEFFLFWLSYNRD